jgi:hypothetical protein
MSKKEPRTGSGATSGRAVDSRIGSGRFSSGSGSVSGPAVGSHIGSGGIEARGEKVKDPIPEAIQYKNYVPSLVDAHIVDGTGRKVFPQSQDPPLTPDDIDKIGRYIAFPPPDKDTNGELHLEDLPVWWLELNNEQTLRLAEVLKTGGGALAIIAPGSPLSVIGAGILAAYPYILAMNKLGGNNGVTISGVLGTLGVIAMPRVGKWAAEAISALRTTVQGKTILDALIFLAGKSPVLDNALKIPPIAAAVALVAGATPLGWIVAGVAGWFIAEQDEPPPLPAGAVFANRDIAREWERLLIASVNNDPAANRISILSHVGLFSALDGGGQSVYANRSKVEDWEKWTLINNSDGTVSFKSNDDRHYLCAEGGGGRECVVNRTQIGPWEKFWMEKLDNGHVALKTFSNNQYVSVQP